MMWTSKSSQRTFDFIRSLCEIRMYDITRQCFTRVTGGYSVRNIRDVDGVDVSIVVFHRGVQYDQDIIYLDMNFEEASKFIVSAGTSNPKS